MSVQIQRQPFLFDNKTESGLGVFPTTRYQGSKNKIVDWIKYYTRDLSFDTVLDAFGGTASVAYMYKMLGKQVFYNDYLKFNYYIGLALVENNNTFIEPDDLDFILQRHKDINYPTFIYETFHDIYFSDDENAWLDMAVTNIRLIKNIYKQALAYYALFQACIIKRPYNLFHRKNLYVRTADVKRSFGNKKTWDTPFDVHFIKFAEEANNAVFDNKRENRSYRSDILDLDIGKPDLVYIDTPYISVRGTGVNYFDFYHFLEGVIDYDQWGKMIDYESKHKKIKNGKNEWCNKGGIHNAFKNLFEKFKDSLLVVSYREDGIPSVNELKSMLEEFNKKVDINKLNYKYALSNLNSKEVIIVAT